MDPDHAQLGVWLPESVITALPRLDLSPPSGWRVFLVLVFAAFKGAARTRSDDAVADLAVADLCTRPGSALER